MRILVTGSEGYIGTALMPHLRAAGHDLVCMDSLLFAGCRVDNQGYSAELIVQDVRDATIDMLRGIDAVIHLAGLSNDPLADLSPKLTQEINHEAAVSLAKLAKLAGVRRFVQSSTCSVYGFQGDDFITEESPVNPLTPYAVSKVHAEIEISALADEAFHVTHLRHGTVYGASPMTRFDLVVNNLVAWAFTTGKVHLKSDGSAWRPLVHVEDICSAFLAAIARPFSAKNPDVFNIGRTDDNIRIRDLAEKVAKEMGAVVEFADGAEADARSYRVDCRKAEASLAGFTPGWDINRGIRQVIDQVTHVGIDVTQAEGHKFGRISHLRHRLETGSVDPQLRVVA